MIGSCEYPIGAGSFPKERWLIIMRAEFGARGAWRVMATLGFFAVGLMAVPAKANPADIILGTAAGIIIGANGGYVYGGREYCWYDAGWQGPGYYWCGYAYRRGYGWGGPAGWRGWARGGPAAHGRPGAVRGGAPARGGAAHAPAPGRGGGDGGHHH